MFEVDAWPVPQAYYYRLDREPHRGGLYRADAAPWLRPGGLRSPKSIGFSLADSPVGLPVWICALFQDVTDGGGDVESVFTLDHLIDDIMLYWLPNTGASWARIYWKTMQSMRHGGGPLAAMEQPAAFVDGVRATFGTLR